MYQIKAGSKKPEIIVYYKWQPYNKINGTLYYCFEYFIQLSLLFKDTKMIIVDKDIINDVELIKNCFRDKYKEEYHYLIDNIKFYKSDVAVASDRTNGQVYLMLDTFSYTNIGLFLRKNKVFLNIDQNLREEDYSLTNSKNLYTFYAHLYQKINKTLLCNPQQYYLLKLGCSFQKEQPNDHNSNYVFVSAPDIPKDFIKESYMLFKNRLQNIKNLFAKIYKIIYIHTGLDTNNRIIVEGFYHGKEVQLIDNVSEIKDSVSTRYNICKNGTINKLLLNSNDLIIQSILKLIK